MIVGILLGAGASRRMGQDKLALPWRESTVLESTLARWQAAKGIDELVLVRRPGSPPVAPPGVRTLVNQSPDDGMGSSLRVAACALSPGVEAVLIGLADMPEVASSTLTTLVESWRFFGAEAIVAPTYQERRGHPVAIGSSHFSALRALDGDTGARHLLVEQSDKVHLVPVDDPGVHWDLDRLEDLEMRP